MEGRCVKVVFGCKQRSSEGQKWPIFHLGVIGTKIGTYNLQFNSESKARLNKGAEVERKLETQRRKVLKLLYPAGRRHRSNTPRFKIQPSTTRKSQGYMYLPCLLLSYFRFLGSLNFETDLSSLFSVWSAFDAIG